MHRTVIILATLGLLISCSSQPRQVLPKPTIKSIAIVPATIPSEISLVNESSLQFLIPLTATANHLDSKQKTKQFNERVRAEDFNPALDLNESAANTLRALGYSVVILSDVYRDKDSPDRVDYKKVKTSADAILHIYYGDISLHSPRSSNSYLPRVNVNGLVYVKGHEDYIYDSYLYYGVDAKAGRSWAIDSDPSFSYPSFETVMSNISDIQNGLRKAARQIGERIAQQVHEAIIE